MFQKTETITTKFFIRKMKMKKIKLIIKKTTKLFNKTNLNKYYNLVKRQKTTLLF